jgi:hypothetical protein
MNEIKEAQKKKVNQIAWSLLIFNIYPHIHLYIIILT